MTDIEQNFRRAADRPEDIEPEEKSQMISEFSDRTLLFFLIGTFVIIFLASGAMVAAEETRPVLISYLVMFVVWMTGIWIFRKN